MDVKKCDRYNNNSALLCFIFLGTVVTTILSAFILAFFYSKFAHPRPLDVSVVIPHYRGWLMPKPQERFIFVVLALLVPMVSFLITLVVFRGIKQHCKPVGNKEAHFRPILNKKCSPSERSILVFAMMFLVTIGWCFPEWLPSKWPPSNRQIVMFFLATFAASGWYVWLQLCFKRTWIPRSNLPDIAIGWIILGTAMLLQIGAWRVFSERSITGPEFRWWGHADAVFYAMAQVMAGKTLLVDLPSQYGLYPELLRPIFKLMGLSVLSFSVLCSVLQLFSLASIYLVLTRVVRDNAIRLTVGLALVMVTFETIQWLLKYNEPYLQYWPIRFFWPAVAVLAFYRYSRQPNGSRAFVVSLVGAIGTLWNMDSGLMIVLAFTGVLILKWFALWSLGHHDEYFDERRQLRNALLIHIATFCIIAFSMFIYLFLKGGGALHWDWLFKYQHLFYGLGFAMIPMPLEPSPWMVLLGIYLLGLLVAAKLWAFKPQSKDAELLSFISMLGLGLFVYYEGRSHDYNLVTVCWPAFVLLSILADRVLRAVRAGLLSQWHLLLPIAVLSVLLFCSSIFLFASVKLGEQAVIAFKYRKIPADQLVSDELNFIRIHTKPGNECVILALRQGLYYTATGTSSPIPGPGYIEMLLVHDLDTFLDKLTHKRYSCIFVGIQSSALDLGVSPLKILKGYKVVARNPHGSMLYLQPKR